MLKAPDLNVITAVDPVEVTEIEIRPQEILQVVLTDAKTVKWRFEDQMSTIRMKFLRHETYWNDGLERNPDSNFQVVPQTESHGALQHHFWFWVNPADCKKVQELERNYNEITTIVFSDEGGNELGRATVWLITEQEDKNEFVDLMENTIWSGKDPVAHEAQLVGLSNRIINQDNGYILNPGWDEQVVFECRQRMMIVELAEPPHAKLRWKACGTHKPDHDGCEANFGITELTSRFINGVRVQRFMISNHLHSLPIGHQKMRLGDVMFRIANEHGDGHPKWDKKINFFVVRDREPDYYFGGEDEGYDEEEAYRFLRQVEGWCKPKPPRKMPVKIEELDVKGDLTAGARCIRVFLPQPERKKTYEIVDPPECQVVLLPVGEELIVHLYKDTSRNAEWKCGMQGTLLKFSYLIHDDHRQRFVFEVDPTARANGETLTFSMGRREKKVHVHCTGHKIVQQVKNSNEPDDADVEKVMNELLTHPQYDWRTVTSLSYECNIRPQTKVVDILDKMSKLGKVREHPNEAGLWGHPSRVGQHEYNGRND